jgi:hypothetical protein
MSELMPTRLADDVSVEDIKVLNEQLLGAVLANQKRMKELGH